MNSIKTRIAAGITIFGLGGLAGLALSAGNQGASQPVADKPLVRTKVIRRTVHVTKHAKPKHPAAGAGGGGSTGAAASGGSSAYGGSTRRSERHDRILVGRRGTVVLLRIGAGHHVEQRRLLGAHRIDLGAGHHRDQRWRRWRRGSAAAAGRGE